MQRVASFDIWMSSQHQTQKLRSITATSRCGEKTRLLIALSIVAAMPSTADTEVHCHNAGDISTGGRKLLPRVNRGSATHPPCTRGSQRHPIVELSDSDWPTLVIVGETGERAATTQLDTSSQPSCHGRGLAWRTQPRNLG